MMKLRLINCYLNTKTLTILKPNLRSFSQFSIQRQKTSSIIQNTRLHQSCIVIPHYKLPQTLNMRSYAINKTGQVKPEKDEDEDELSKTETDKGRRTDSMDSWGYMSLAVLGITGALMYYFYSDYPPIADQIVDYGVDNLDLDKAKAAEAFHLARVINPSNKFAWYNEANIFVEQGEYKKAMKCYNKAIEADPNYIDAHYNKGILYFIHGKYEESLKQFELVLEINPKFIMALNNKGNALVQLQRFEEARKAYNEAIEMDDMYVDAIENRKRLDMIENSLKKKSWFNK